jgi:hypothetical protein
MKQMLVFNFNKGILFDITRRTSPNIDRGITSSHRIIEDKKPRASSTNGVTVIGSTNAQLIRDTAFALHSHSIFLTSWQKWKKLRYPP